MINYKDWAIEGALRGARPGARTTRGHSAELYWQTDTSISGTKSSGYIEDDTLKSPQFVVQQLIDIVSKNGNLLLNIGPKPDGTIPDEVQQVLRDVGSWLAVNGDAIYGTRPWKIYGEGPTQVMAGSFHDTDTATYTAEDFRFTTKGNALYAIEMGWPGGGEAVIHSLGTAVGSQKVESVTLLGSDAKILARQEADGLHLQLPAPAPGKYAYVFRMLFGERGPII